MTIEIQISNYINFCENQKKLDKKTIKAYTIDLHQFHENCNDTAWGDRTTLSTYIQFLHEQYAPNSVKRKIACLHAFFNYLVMIDDLEYNPLIKVQIKFKQPKRLPRTIATDELHLFYQSIYQIKKDANTSYKRFCITRDIAVFELLLGTGMRISEICGLRTTQLNMHDKSIRIIGKGNKERLLHIGNEVTFQAILAYSKLRNEFQLNHTYFFINKLHHRLSEQSVRNSIPNYISSLTVKKHITPHMFRHTFATLLLESDVDIRFIQQILGHSSITTTQIYTHISSNKQKEILNHKNPRNFILAKEE